MKKCWVICLLGLWLLGLTAVVSAQQNHFKVYTAKSAEPIKPIPVVLKDQFMKDQVKNTVTAVVYFANPVKKIHDNKTFAIEQPNAHLTWYQLARPLIGPKRLVKFKNQFGEQSLTLGPAPFLLVPTQKIEPNSTMPDKFNHFLAYKVVSGEFKPIKVQLIDQFSKEPVTVEVSRPLFFCNPVVKNRGIIPDPHYHLACYLIKGAPPANIKSISIANQFGKNRLYPGVSMLLCVPTEKLGFEVIK